MTLAPAVAACGGSEPPAAESPPGADAPAPTEASQDQNIVATATKQGTIQVYSEPDESKKQQTLSNPRLINNDPNAKVELVLLVKEQQDDWLKVALPVRPNGTTGWVKADEFETDSHNYRIEVSLGGFQLKAFDGDKEIFDAPIAVATDDYPTPGGDYYTTELLQPPDPKGDYGPYAIGLSGFSETLTTFNGGDGQLGIHGTNQPEKIGSKVSHGCIRLKNEDITKLVDLDMPLGTPVIINA